MADGHNGAVLGERIAALESQLNEIASREDKAEADRQRKWEVLNDLRDEVRTVSGQQALITDRLNAVGQMADVARDFVAAARDIPTRADVNLLTTALHETNLELAKLETEFKIVKAARDASANRMWVVITGALLAGLSALLGVIVNWVTKH